MNLFHHSITLCRTPSLFFHIVASRFKDVIGAALLFKRRIEIGKTAREPFELENGHLFMLSIFINVLDGSLRSEVVRK